MLMGVKKSVLFDDKVLLQSVSPDETGILKLNEHF
jgi:hypothetical protein